ncbi:porin [Duodenibacillus massiliensis]|uniref:porin n=1 Tax=Duodenibacillus massiliensis TaxID=1852381 RepID=UPI003AB8648D
MFKKSLTAVAVLGAFAGAAMASQVTMYGVVDTGLMYTYKDVADGDPTTDFEVNKLALNSGINAASRFGLKGTEDLGNGLKIGFKLENGFKADDGTFKTAGRLFDREASLSVYSDFGTLSMGRMGAVGSSAGTYDIVYLFGDAFDGGDSEVFGFVTSGRADNMVTYQTPKFAGVQGTFQYSFNQDGQEGDKSSLNNQVFAAAATGEFGAFNVVGAYEYTNRSADARTVVRKDAQTIYLGGNYDCGFAKTFVLAQYFEGASAAAGFDITLEFKNDAHRSSAKGLKGYGLHVGTQVPVMAGTLTAAVYYVDGKLEGIKNDRGTAQEDNDVSYIGASARYVYALSKRTEVYLGGGVAQAKIDEWNVNDSDRKTFIGQAYTGLTHRF